MMSYEDQLIREATGEYQGLDLPEPEESNETGDQQDETCSFFQSERNKKHCYHCGEHRDKHAK